MGDREGIIMFPLLSRLPQLSLKRDSQTACLLIHLNFSNTSPPMSASPPTLPPTLNGLSHNKLLFILLFSKYIFLSSCFSAHRCPPHRAFLLQPRLTSLLFVGLAESPPHPPFSSLSLCFAAGLRERKKMMRMNILACTQPEEK